MLKGIRFIMQQQKFTMVTCYYLKTWMQFVSSAKEEEEYNSSNGRMEVETCILVVVGNCKPEEAEICK